MINYERYDRNMVDAITQGMEKCKTASELANLLGVDVSGLIKHIKKYRQLKMTTVQNKCGLKNECHIIELCSNCSYARYREDRKECRYCHKANCNQSCTLFTSIPACKRLKKFPYCCNGCDKRIYCKINHYIYDSNEVWKLIQNERSNPRKGSHADEGEFLRLSKLLKPLIKEKHQSLPQVFLSHKEEIRWSYPTILKFIDLGLIPEISNIDLTKRVKYPKSYKKKNNEPTNYAFLTGRTYDDFISFISNNPNIEVVEMDTVLSCHSSSYCLLTLLFRKSNFMLAFLLKNKTIHEICRVFEYLQSQLGTELYRQTFACVLTDNGSEFANPEFIEFDYKTGEKLCNLFYCDPGKSGQKGKIEKNHVELRKIFPKGTDFSLFNQQQLNKALSHINSEPRSILNKNCPGVIAKIFLNEKILTLNEYQFINPDLVDLHPSLLK